MPALPQGNAGPQRNEESGVFFFQKLIIPNTKGP